MYVCIHTLSVVLMSLCVYVVSLGGMWAWADSLSAVGGPVYVLMSVCACVWVYVRECVLCQAVKDTNPAVSALIPPSSFHFFLSKSFIFLSLLSPVRLKDFPFSLGMTTWLHRKH